MAVCMRAIDQSPVVNRVCSREEVLGSNPERWNRLSLLNALMMLFCLCLCLLLLLLDVAQVFQINVF